MKKVILASLTAIFVLTGCNTVKGIGQDISSVGNAVSNSAKKVEQKIDNRSNNNVYNNNQYNNSGYNNNVYGNNNYSDR